MQQVIKAVVSPVALWLCGTIAASVAVILCAIVTVQAATPLARAVISYPNANPRVAPLWIAQDLDFFSKYGVKGEVVFVRNNQSLIAGIAAGDIDVGYTGGATVIGAAAGGLDLKMVSSFASRGRGYLVVRPEISTPADLRGKRFGVISIGGAQWMYAMLALEQFGLNAVKDRVQFLIIGDPTALARALEANLIDATVFTTPSYNAKLKQQGLNMLAELTPPLATTGIVASRSFTQKNPETLENIMKALIEGLTFVLAPGNKSQVIKTLMNRFKISDTSLVEAEYADAMKDLEPKPYPAAEGVRNMQRLMQVQNPRLANINPASLIDSTFVRKLDESGFIGQLQARYGERR
jgi:ABC-type nitrate/sulfonate/bicarbonate transport system substrate-binding protein